MSFLINKQVTKKQSVPHFFLVAASSPFFTPYPAAPAIAPEAAAFPAKANKGIRANGKIPPACPRLLLRFFVEVLFVLVRRTIVMSLKQTLDRPFYSPFAFFTFLYIEPANFP